jgi:hypothetical protein
LDSFKYPGEPGIALTNKYEQGNLELTVKLGGINLTDSQV